MELAIFLGVVALILATASGTIILSLSKTSKQLRQEANQYIMRNIELREKLRTTKWALEEAYILLETVLDPGSPLTRARARELLDARKAKFSEGEN